MKKIDLGDVTFIFPARIDSLERLNNALAVCKYLSRHLYTNIMICEASTTSTQFLNSIPGYYYIKDDNPIFHHTHYRNQMIKKCNTPIIGIWDLDILAPIKQIVEAVNAIRYKNFSMTWPYSGICYNVPPDDSNVFREKQDINFVIRAAVHYNEMYGRLTTGGAFFVRKSDYIKIGMENENIYGWGPEDMERLKRATILDYSIFRVKGDLFHLFHPRNINSYYANREIRLKNINELLRICSLSAKELSNEIKLWPWLK